MSESESEKGDQEKNPEFIVDTDWKEQVAKEKEAAQQSDSSNDDVTDDATPTTTDGDDASEMPPPPPASFEMLVSMLFTQAMAALGQIPDPATGKANVNKAYAKHYIDTLDMLSEKTKDNLSDNEAKMLSEALHALRMTFVNTREDS